MRKKATTKINASLDDEAFKETIKDKERLDFVLKNCNIEYDKFYKTSFENRDEIDEVMQESI